MNILRLLPLLLLPGFNAGAQTAPNAGRPPLISLEIPDSLYPARLWLATGTGVVVYSAAMVGLNQAWYADYPRSSFHTFNDMREWMQMDKMGHWLMSYNESRWIGDGARWTGMNHQQSAWAGFAGGQIIQTSLEVLDGYSSEWGFSWGDIAFNLLGSGLYLGQELGWHDQRIVMKMSAWPVTYPDTRIYPYTPAGSDQWTILEQRADELYGTGPVNLFLKNYNTLVVWASVNPRSFGAPEWIPPWLNVAAGMGADNLFAGFGYEWDAEKNCEGPDCVRYRLDSEVYPRTRQFYLSLDVDLRRIRVRNRALRALLGMVNIIKVPSPTLMINTEGKVRFYPVFF